MKLCVSWIPITALFFASFSCATAASSTDPSTVLVLVNDAWPAETGTSGVGASVYVGQHYTQARNIPSANVLHLNIPLSTLHYATNEFISYPDFLTYIQNPIKSYLNTSGLKDQILYIVPTYGIPVMLDALGADPNSRISIDSVLAGMYSNSPATLLTNPYFTSDPSSSPTHIGNWKNPQRWKMYLVTRLDGPTALIAAGLVDKAISAEATLKKTDGVGYFDWQHRLDSADPGTHAVYTIDQSVLNAYNLSTAAGITSVLNDQTVSGVMFSPASTYTYTGSNLAVFAEGASLLTSRFNFTPIQAGRFRATLNVTSNTGGVGLTWYRLFSADRKSYWELIYPFPGFYFTQPVMLSKVVNGTSVGSCSVPVSIKPVATDLSFTFSSGGGEIFKGATSLCKFSDSSSTRIDVSQGEMVFKDLSVNLTGVFVQDNNSVSVWNDSFTSDTTGNYTWITAPKQAQNAAWAWGWYSSINDSYSFVNGAVASQYSSYTASSLRAGGVPNVDGNWCVYFLRQGVTATWGATSEPAGNYANGDILLGHFWRGYTFGESSYMAVPTLNWFMVFVGDPLYTPPIFKVPPSPPVVAISGPVDGAAVNGYVTLSGTSESPSGVSSVSILVDGTLLQIASGTTVWSYILDTTQLANGPHVIMAVVQDDTGNQTTASIHVTINNAAPVITSATSTSGATGSSFRYQIAASNSPTSFGATGLPSGLAVNTSSGLISGIAPAAGIFSVTLSASNSSGTGTTQLTLVVTGGAPTITSPTTATANVASAFSYQIVATNSPTSFGAIGLPSGISVNTSTGLLSGTPQAAGTTSVTLTASNAAGTGTLGLTLTISAGAPVITSSASAAGTAGAAFNYQIAATNSPTSFGATGLPSGLSVNTSTGAISGTPQAAGTSSITLTASNASGPGSSVLTLTINAAGPPPTNLATFVKADTATQGTWKGIYGSDGELINSDSTNPPTYASVSIGATANTYVWTNSTTDVRAPQKAAASDRIMSAWYSAGSFTVDVNITDGKSHQISLYADDWDSGAGRQERIDALDGVTQAVLNSQTLSNFGQGQHLVWTVSGHVIFRVTNLNPFSNALLSGVFFGGTAPAPMPVITSPATAAATAGATFSYTITATNNPTSFNASGLPAGLSINTSTGLISGTPSAAGTASVSLSASNAAGTGTGLLTLTINPAGPPPSNSAVFIKSDTATQGTWKGVYGSDGEIINSDSSNPPVYASVNLGATANTYVWTNSTADIRAPQKAAASDRIMSAWYSSSSFTVDVNVTDGKSHQVSLYADDWDNGAGRQERIDVLDGATQAVLNSQTLSNFGQGQYLIWTVSGHVTFRMTNLNPFSNGLLSGIFFGGTAVAAPVITSPTSATAVVGSSFNYAITAANNPVSFNATPLPAGLSINTATGLISGTPTAAGTMAVNLSAVNAGGTGSNVLTLTVNPPPANSAIFTKTDTTTLGNWKGVYGASGELINSDSTNPPSFASVNVSATANTYVWANSTTDIRAPQKAAASDRLESAWYSGGSFTVDVNITDGKTHQIALYTTDWDGNGRLERIDVLDGATLAVLNSQTVGSFGPGRYLVWNISGHVTFRVTNLNSGSNALLSGIFF